MDATIYIATGLKKKNQSAPKRGGKRIGKSGLTNINVRKGITGLVTAGVYLAKLKKTGMLPGG